MSGFLRQYCLAGGMPEVMNNCLEGRNYKGWSSASLIFAAIFSEVKGF